MLLHHDRGIIHCITPVAHKLNVPDSELLSFQLTNNNKNLPHTGLTVDSCVLPTSKSRDKNRTKIKIPAGQVLGIAP